MAVFQAFRALRPIPEKASSVAALPYDVVTREEAKLIGDKNPDSFLHVDRPEMDLPDETDLYDAKVYDKARENLQNMERNGILSGKSIEKSGDDIDCWLFISMGIVDQDRELIIQCSVL